METEDPKVRRNQESEPKTWKVEQRGILPPKRPKPKEKGGEKAGGEMPGWAARFSRKGICLHREVLGCGGQLVGHAAPEPAPCSPERGLVTQGPGASYDSALFSVLERGVQGERGL